MSDPDVRAAGLARGQHGLITFDQALQVGLSPDQVQVRLARGAWERVVRGVYRIAGAPETWQQRAHAAQLAVVDAGGATSHVTSGALHGLLRPALLPHLTVPPTSSARCPIAKVHRALIEPIDLATVDGIRTTSVSRMVTDMASVFDRPGLEELVDDAILSGKAAPESILRALDRVGRHRRGRVLLRSVLEAWTEAIEPGSHAEMRLLRRMDEWGVPRPVTQFQIEDARVDAAWPAARVALEYEGVRHHAVRRSAEDEVRYQVLERLGWRVVPATKRDLLPGERRLPDVLERLLGAGRPCAPDRSLRANPSERRSGARRASSRTRLGRE